MSKKFLTEGISDTAGISAAASYAETLGYAIGTPEYEQNLNKFAMMGAVEQDKAGRAAQRTAGFGSQLSSYMGGLEATRAARRYGFNTQGDVTPFQILLGLADQDKMLDARDFTGRTTRDQLMDYASTLTGRQAQWGGQVADALIGAGAAPGMSAYTAAGRYGIGTDQEAQAAASMINTAGAYGRITNAQGEAILGLSRQYAPAAGSILSQNFMAPMYQAGMNTDQVTGIMNKLGGAFKQMTPYQMGLAGQIWGGDMGAQSYAAWNQPGLMTTMGYNPSAYRLWTGR